MRQLGFGLATHIQQLMIKDLKHNELIPFHNGSLFFFQGNNTYETEIISPSKGWTAFFIEVIMAKILANRTLYKVNSSSQSRSIVQN